MSLPQNVRNMPLFFNNSGKFSSPVPILASGILEIEFGILKDNFKQE